MVLPEILRENLVHQVVGIVLVHLDLFEDYPALAHDVIVVEDRIQHQVGENIERCGDMLIENLEVEADGLFAGERVQVAADRVHLARNALGGSRLRSLEDHVFDEMRDAVYFRQLMSRAGPDPHTHGNRPDMLHAFGQNSQAGG